MLYPDQAKYPSLTNSTIHLTNFQQQLYQTLECCLYPAYYNQLFHLLALILALIVDNVQRHGVHVYQYLSLHRYFYVGFFQRVK